MPEKVNIMIVEDESIVAMDLAAGLDHDGYNVTAIADNHQDAVKSFKEVPVDILLMDIHIQGDIDGVDTAAELMLIKQVPLIYITAFTDPQTISRVMQTSPAAFLTKPYNLDNVRISIELALNNFAVEKQHDAPARVMPMHHAPEKTPGKEHFLKLMDHIFIKQNYRYVKLKLTDILFAEALSNHVKIQTGTQNFMVRLSLSEFLDKLAFPHLIRVHRSYAVNISQIKSFDDHIIALENHEIPIGRTYTDDFINHFNLR